MKNEFYFTDSKYREVAKSTSPKYNITLDKITAFFLLIKDVKFRDLDNFCEIIKDELELNLSLENIYDLLQDPSQLTEEMKEKIFAIAQRNVKFGNNTILINGNISINTSSWINHSLNVAEAAYKLSLPLENVDSDSAYVLGLLHDIGRKFKTDMEHTIYGYQYLVDLGYKEEAKICLTHSHLRGERCANNEQAVEGWSCDNGISKWDDNIKKDDLTNFLLHTSYDILDDLVCMADLMATNSKIVSVNDRLKDIATRRKLDPTNRKFFLFKLCNLLNDYLYAVGQIDEKKELDYDKLSLEEVQSILEDISNTFFSYYSSIGLDKPIKM